jgi:hypothetical protein
VAQHAGLETASIPTEPDLRSYRQAQEVTNSMSIETIDTHAHAAAAVALVRQRAPETASCRSPRDRYLTIQGICRSIGSTAPATHYPVAAPSWST